ncbi:hypothetical protein M8C21_025732 [Ambrosia artemisiifolia]|uniref:Uncharacterized protein n=1 Tax=Ambrosia artemisiifolia TaxID=4212 RepID=A0AAD5GVP8_AMBAR|nr:hypothetical protein M8C21_025732 [Ambrosia artemisiifolia]
MQPKSCSHCWNASTVVILPIQSAWKTAWEFTIFTRSDGGVACKIGTPTCRHVLEEGKIKVEGGSFKLMAVNGPSHQRREGGLKLEMAQLMSPVCTEGIKFQKAGGWRMRMLSNNNSILLGCKAPWRRRRRPLTHRLKVTTDPSPFSSSDAAAADDYYAVLGLLPDATPEQIKKAYYNCMKSCHPDLSGDDPETTNFCMFINEVLSDPAQRMVYDEIHGYALTAINPFHDDTYPKDHVFVDEFSCIGCKNCANVCSTVFMIEEDYGRARVCNQQGNPDLVQEAIDSCPVDCIHWTSAAQLSLLEDEMRRVERVNVALMLAGMGSSADVFRMASSRWEKRQNKILEQARIRMMKSNDKAEPYWTNLWGNAKNQPSTEEEVRERASRAAAAARRWREYSRRGVDKPATYKLPGNLSPTEK